MRWPGHQARGVYSPANPGTILIGRGEDFAWSLTSAGSDLVDEYAEVLCGGSSTRYRYKGRCRRMRTVDAGTIKGAGRVRYRTTVHGPVTGYATAGGKRIAIARKRASFGRDVLWQLPFRDATIGRISGTRSFIRAFARSPFTFNVGYADDRDIAMFSAGELPRRDPRVDPRLPTLGTGAYEWRGTLPSRRLPQQVNPPRGALLNWNNSPAPGFGAADDNWSYGSLHRVSLLQGQIARRAKHDLASVTSAMNAAATQDLRSTGLTPTLSTLLRGGPAPSARAAAHARAARGLARRRLEPARPRRGRRDGRGRRAGDHGRALSAAVRRRAGRRARPAARRPQGARGRRTTAPRSGFTGGGINYIDKDLRPLLGTRFKHPFRTRFCGGGDLGACRTAVWGALDAAGAELAAAQGNRGPGRLEVGRRGRAHRLRARAADDDDPLHEPARAGSSRSSRSRGTAHGGGERHRAAPRSARATTGRAKVDPCAEPQPSGWRRPPARRSPRPRPRPRGRARSPSPRSRARSRGCPPPCRDASRTSGRP